MENKESNPRRKTRDAGLSLEMGKLPPQAVDLEEVILGATLIDKSIISIVVGILHEDSFYKEEHRYVFSAIKKLYEKNFSIDILTVTKQLRSDGCLDNCGGPFFISQLTNRVASGANVETHCRIVEQAAIKRRIIQSCMVNISKAYDDTYDVFDLLSDLQNDLGSPKIMVSGTSSKPEKRVNAALKSIEEAQKNKMIGLSTGIDEVDEQFNGFEKGDLWIVAGRPGMGKTAFLIHLALHIERTYGPVYYDEMEMSDSQVAIREMSNICGIPGSYMKKQLSAENQMQISKAAEDLLKKKIYVNTEVNVRLSQLRPRVKKAVHDHGCLMYLVDYLQLIDAEREKNETTATAVGKVSRMLKIIAKENNIPVIAFSQLSREVEKRGDKRPMLQDLRDSGAIEQDADGVIFLYRPEYYGIPEYTINGTVYPSHNQIEFVFAKNRSGDVFSSWTTCDIGCNRFGDFNSLTFIPNIAPEKEERHPWFNRD